MDLIVEKSERLSGSVNIPPNKSHSFRALIMAALADGVSRIHSPAVSGDWMRGTEALEMLGARVEPKASNTWEIIGAGGNLSTADDVVDCGNSGIILRFFSALCACCDGYTVLSGDHSLRHIRLCGPVVQAINDLGAWAVTTKGDGHAPVVVRGRLKGGQTQIDGQDSQPVSSLLIACTQADAPTELNVTNPGEKPWVRVTMHWLDRVGAECVNEDFQRYLIRGRQRWEGFQAEIPLDWSAAMYPIVAGLITPDSEVRLPGMDFDDCQGDKAVVDVLRSMGGDIEITGDTVIARSSKLTGREIDCNDFIDQFMLLAVVGACAQGQTVLTNAEMARHKECDRISATCRALEAMGADVEEKPDGLVVGQSRLRGTRLDSQEDHRMVMTFAVAGMVAEGETVISDMECIKKTFPDFVGQMRGVGCEIQGR